MRGQLAGYAGILGVGVAIGLSAGYRIWRPPVVVETVAPAVRQQDSSLVLARRPDTVVRIRHVVPPGFTPERHVELVIQPRLPVEPVNRSSMTPGIAESRELPNSAIRLVALPVRVSLTVGRLKDGTHRVIASSPDGVVLDSLSIDVPLTPAVVVRPLRYAVGVTRDLLSGAWGAEVTRELGSSPWRVLAGGDARGLRVGLAMRF